MRQRGSLGFSCRVKVAMRADLPRSARRSSQGSGHIGGPALQYRPVRRWEALSHEEQCLMMNA
jgi:hypothetical protein